MGMVSSFDLNVVIKINFDGEEKAKEQPDKEETALLRAPASRVGGGGLHKNAGPFQVVALEEEAQTNFMHNKRF